MPYSRFSSNVRKRQTQVREARWFSVLGGEASAASGLSLSASVGLTFNSASVQNRFFPSDQAMYTFVGDTGREVQLEFEVTAYLELYIQPEDTADRFVMLKRVSPTMPNPTPLDSQGKPT